jgi:hypothetical protein
LFVAVEEKRLDLQAPPEGESGLLRACGRCCCCCHRWGEELETEGEKDLLKRGEAPLAEEK